MKKIKAKDCEQYYEKKYVGRKFRENYKNSFKFG